MFSTSISSALDSFSVFVDLSFWAYEPISLFQDKNLPSIIHVCLFFFFPRRTASFNMRFFCKCLTFIGNRRFNFTCTQEMRCHSRSLRNTYAYLRNVCYVPDWESNAFSQWNLLKFCIDDKLLTSMIRALKLNEQKLRLLIEDFERRENFEILTLQCRRLNQKA